MTPRRVPGLIVDAALFMMTVFWAANIIVVKLLLSLCPPLTLSAIRFLVVAGFGLAVLLVRGGPKAIRREDLPRLFAASVLGISLYQILFICGLAGTTAFTANLLQGSEPLFILVLLGLTGIAPVRPRQWTGVVLALLGAAVFFLQDTPRGVGLTFGWGEALSTLSAFVFASYGLVSAPLFARYPGHVVMAYTMGLGAIPLALVASRELMALSFRSLGPWFWAGCLYSCLLPVYLGFWIWNWAIVQKGIAHAALYLFVDIVLSGIFAHLILGETFGPTRILGAVIIMAGIGVARSPQDSAQPGAA